MTKRSDAKRSGKRPEPVFFIDRSLGRRDVPGALLAQGYDCRLHDDIFPQDTEDQDWLMKVGSEGWAVLTKDERIRYRPAEISALRNAGVQAFILVSGKLRGPEIAEALVRAMPMIVRLV